MSGYKESSVCQAMMNQVPVNVKWAIWLSGQNDLVSVRVKG